MPTGPAHGPSLPLTGERTVPGVPEEAYWFARHVVAYRWAAGHVRGAATVLDAGCGEGYGLALLAASLPPSAAPGSGGTVIGVERDPTVAAHARRRYAAVDPRVRVVEADLAALPLPDDGVDLAVSLQVVEHLDDVHGALAELARVVAPGGTVVVTTPNRLTFSPGRTVPLNPFHVREFTADELAVVLERAGLVDVEVGGVHHGPRLARTATERGVDLGAALVATAPDGWPAWLAALVPTVTDDDFVVHGADVADVAASLDLAAVARVPA